MERARITLELGGTIAPSSITCGIYGWMVHTRFFETEESAKADFKQMQDELSAILEFIPLKNDPNSESKMVDVSEAIEKFVERFT